MKVLSVFYHGNANAQPALVGRLSYKNQQGFFEYDADFLKCGLNLSPFLLKTHNQLQDASRDPFNGIHGLFNDSLPDGWGLYVMDKHLQKKGIDTSLLTPIDRLAYIGDRAMGALSYQPDEGDSFFNEQEERIDLNNLARNSIDLYTGNTQEVLNYLAINGTPSGGARPKALLGINGDKTVHGAYDLKQGFEHWIAKFPTGTNAEKKAEGSIEYLYAKMAQKANVNFPDTRLVSGDDDNAFFLIKRFDRLNNMQRVHMHSLAGLINANFRFPDFSYKSLFHVCKTLTNSQQEVNELYLRMLFNVITGNRDDHTKNFSFLMDSKGQWTNSPAYDITFNEGIQGEHSMLVGHSGKNISWDDLMFLADNANIKKTEVKHMLDQVISSIDIWKQEAKHYNIPKNQMVKITSYMEKQSRLLL